MRNTLPCAQVENSTHRRSHPGLTSYGLIQPVCSEYCSHAITVSTFVVCTYTAAFSRHRNWKSKEERGLSYHSHIFSWQLCWLCLLSCSDRFQHSTCSCCSSMSMSFHSSQLAISRKEQNQGSPNICLRRPQGSRMLCKMKHCFDVMKLGVSLEICFKKTTSTTAFSSRSPFSLPRDL